MLCIERHSSALSQLYKGALDALYSIVQNWVVSSVALLEKLLSLYTT